MHWYPSSFSEAPRTLAIVADDGQATIDGGGSVGLLSVQPGADVVLANLRLRNGNSTQCCGGAIYNWKGTMTMQRLRQQQCRLRWCRLQLERHDGDARVHL